MFNEEEYMAILLTIKDGFVSPPNYINKYISYNKIGEICADAVKYRYIIQNKGKYVITYSGKVYLDTLLYKTYKVENTNISRLAYILLKKFDLPYEINKSSLKFCERLQKY